MTSVVERARVVYPAGLGRGRGRADYTFYPIGASLVRTARLGVKSNSACMYSSRVRALSFYTCTVYDGWWLEIFEFIGFTIS